MNSINVPVAASANNDCATSYFTKRVCDKIFSRVSSSPFIKAPFPCFQVNRLFDLNLYSQFIQHLPEDSAYFKSREGRTSNPYALQSRKTLCVTDPEQLSGIREDQRQFWKEVGEFFSSQEFTTELFRHYLPYLKCRYDSLSFETNTRVDLTRDTTGYRIFPHTDSPSKIFTAIIYLPKEPFNLDLGTSIYVPDRPLVSEHSHHFKPEEQTFTELHRAPYSAGTMFSFMKTNNSFHGREPIETQGVERNLIIITVQHKNKFIGA